MIDQSLLAITKAVQPQMFMLNFLSLKKKMEPPVMFWNICLIISLEMAEPANQMA